MPYTARELPAEEWDRLTGLPIAENLPSPETSAIFVIEAEGQIVATWAAMTVVHAEGCWIDPAYRRNAAVVINFTSGFFAMLRAHGIPQILTVTQTPEVDTLAEKLGGQELGKLWLLTVPPEES